MFPSARLSEASLVITGGGGGGGGGEVHSYIRFHGQ